LKICRKCKKYAADQEVAGRHTKGSDRDERGLTGSSRKGHKLGFSPSFKQICNLVNLFTALQFK